MNNREVGVLMPSVLERIRNNDPVFDVPSPETVLRASGYSLPERQQMLANAKAVGRKDADNGVLTGDSQQAQGLLDLLDDVPNAQQRVLDKGRARERQRVDQAIQEIESALGNGPSKDAKSIRSWRVEFVKAQIRDIEDVTPKSTTFLIVSVVLAVAGLVVDSVFLADALLAAESDLVSSTSTAILFALIVAAFLGGAALLSGSLWGRSRRPQPVAESLCDRVVWDKEQPREIARLKSKGLGLKVASIVAALVVLAVYGFFARLRIAQLTENQATDDTGDSLGFVVHDQRGSAKWIIYAIILLALLSLIIFWWEGHTMGLATSLRKYRKELPKRQQELEEISTDASKVLNDRKGKLEDGMKSIERFAVEAINTLGHMHQSIVEDYKDAAIDACHKSNKAEIRAQVPKFQVLQPLTSKQTQGVKKYLAEQGGAPTRDGRPAIPADSMPTVTDGQSAAAAASSSQGLDEGPGESAVDYGAGNG